MRHITSQLRVAATRRRMRNADEALAHSVTTMRIVPTDQFSYISPLVDLTTERRAHEASQSPRPLPPAPSAPRTALPARASSDFTGQVMARLATPTPEQDPRERKARQTRSKMRRLVGVYLALVLLSGVALLLIAAFAPWTIMGLVTALVSGTLLAMTLASLVSRATGGVVSGIGVAYIAMLAALAPPLWLLARRATRGRSSSSRRL